MTPTFPNGTLLAFYGDDFTGSTDAMEVTALAGLKTVLFAGTPSEETLAEFADYPIIGIAGVARSKDPVWMEANLRPALAALAARHPRILQYKVCSTFDSSARIGSIGKAIDIGRDVLELDWSPCIVGAPQLGRWQIFSNLFAVAAGTAHRIDRHPTMSRHPVTPMHEADLRLHLSQQTNAPVGSIDIGEMQLGLAAPKVLAARDANQVTFIDVADTQTQAIAGRLVWENSERSLFSASSSGLQYALVAHWREQGLLAAQPPEFASPPPVDRLLVLSGSCSPVTAAQIAAAEAAGFASIRLDVIATSDRKTAVAELTRVEEAMAEGFAKRRGVIVYAARTVDDPNFSRLKERAEQSGMTFDEAQDSIGRALGSLAHACVSRFDLTRLVVAGGDTSGRVLEALPIHALELKYPLGRGAPICASHSHEDAFNRLELVLKGGQLGQASLFVDALG
jgi:3-oxoisoapionate kinase